MATRQRYPLSTPQGQAIPLEVIKPMGVIKLTYTASGFTSIALDAEYLDRIFIASSDSDCYIDFSAAPVDPSTGVMMVDKVFIPSGVLIAFVTNTLDLAVRGDVASGTLFIQIADTWSGLALEQQIHKT